MGLAFLRERGNTPRPALNSGNGRGCMNITERKYADELYKRQLAKEIIAYSFEPVKLRLAKNTYYAPDFLVVCPDRFEFHEVKGFARDDAMVKLKVAARLFPWFCFVLVKRSKREWIFKDVPSL